MQPTDDDVVDAMTKRNGAGPKQGKRRPRRSTDDARDERPQGYQPDRMRALWADIDDARAKLAPEPPPGASGADGGSLLRALVPTVILDLAPCALVARAASWLAALPGVGWLTAFWRSSAES